MPTLTPIAGHTYCTVESGNFVQTYDHSEYTGCCFKQNQSCLSEWYWINPVKVTKLSLFTGNYYPNSSIIAIWGLVNDGWVQVWSGSWKPHTAVWESKTISCDNCTGIRISQSHVPQTLRPCINEVTVDYEILACNQYTNQTDCEAHGCWWWNGSCHDDQPTQCSQLNNQFDCERWGCYWWGGACHSEPEQQYVWLEKAITTEDDTWNCDPHATGCNCGDEGPQHTHFNIDEEVMAYTYLKSSGGFDFYGHRIKHEWWYNDGSGPEKKWEYEWTIQNHYVNVCVWTWWKIGLSYGPGIGIIKTFIDDIYIGSTNEYWIDPPPCSYWQNSGDCETYGCWWWNGSCHTDQPTACNQLNNQYDCERWGCYWYNGSCHSEPTGTDLEILENESTWYEGPFDPGEVGRLADVKIRNNGVAGSFRLQCFYHPGGAGGPETPGGFAEGVIEAGQTKTVTLWSTIPYKPPGPLDVGVKAWGETEPEPHFSDIYRWQIIIAGACEDYLNQAKCESAGCYWWNNSCHDGSPSCPQIDNPEDCSRFGCYWWGGACHSELPPPPCTYWDNEPDCTVADCYWWNNSCHDGSPSCPQIDNPEDCSRFGCYWYDNSCHSEPPPLDICAWIIDQIPGWPSQPVTDIPIESVMALIDSFVLQIPPSGYSFIPTIQQVFGVIDYYLGFDGDEATGCDLFP